jgi:hypothetical protein
VSELVSLTWAQVIRRDSGEAQLSIVGKGDLGLRACTSLRLSDEEAIYETQALQLVTDLRSLGTTR